MADGLPAAQVRLGSPTGVAVGPDSSLYFPDDSNGDFRILRVDVSGILTTEAGNGFCALPTSPCGDGGQATQAQLTNPRGVAVGLDGSIYIRDPNRVRRVGPDGIISTVTGAGDGCSGSCNIGGLATRALLNTSNGVALALDGSLYVAGGSGQGVLRVTSALPGFSLNEQLITAEDGSETYVFDNSGLHLRTLDALTGAVRYQFSYDTNTYLRTITDVDGNVTTIERTANGSPTTIIGPFGQRTTLNLDANGYLARITNPAGEFHQMSYTADGLLTSFTDPKNNNSVMAYDTLGRLSRDTDATGGFQNLTHAIVTNGE
jgi:YD repeat-containing protein